MAGRPFLNVALPATATAAVAVVSYLLYKKTYSPDDYKQQLTNAATATTPDKVPSSPVSPPPTPTPVPIPSDPDPTPMTMTKPQTTPDSSPCESPPLAFYEAADITPRIFDSNGDEGNNNNIWTLERLSDHLAMISEQINPFLHVPSTSVDSRGDMREDHSLTNIWKDEVDVRSVPQPVDNASSQVQPSIKPQVTEKIETMNKVARKASKSGMTSGAETKPEKIQSGKKGDVGTVAAVLMKNAAQGSAAGSKNVDAKSLLNLQLDETDYDMMGMHDKVPKIFPELEPHAVDPTLASNPFAIEPTAQTNVSQIPLGTGAFDSATHSPSEDMLESPCVSNYSDIHSEESSDSGKGGSDINMPAVKPHPVVYEFELPQDLCGLLIGQQGSTIKFIKNKTQANIYLKRHHYNSRLKLCTITGNQSEVDAALVMIRTKFPLTKYPIVTLHQVNPQLPACDTFSLPETMQLILPEGIMCDVYLSSLVSANHFFVQQTVHPTYPALSTLTAKMTKCYSKAGTPSVPGSVLPSAICAAPVLGGWYRAQVTHVFNERECGVKYLDYGGYAKVPTASLKQIRGDFLTIPFQASECFLANVKPINDEAGWTIEAHQVFEELAQGQILQAQVVGYSETGVPFVYLYSRQGVLTHFINRELVSRGVAMWYDHQV
uniref:Tudor domain-containing protein n=1 Tax=Strigamia maritima TaxID=126957 RepID=T1J2M7_STRMM